tara:strand:- start:319 stop:483 length:165 start_codon:yes stop_codon:yes gene_type:complete
MIILASSLCALDRKTSEEKMARNKSFFIIKYLGEIKFRNTHELKSDFQLRNNYQ